MGKTKIYLDNCSYNRPFDDQLQIKIRLETEAVLYIQSCVRKKKYSLVWSYMLDYENDNNPYGERKDAIAPWREVADEYCCSSDSILATAQEFIRRGIKAKDALHIACAITSGCGYFITTDNKLASKAMTGIKIINPLDFVKELEVLQ